LLSYLGQQGVATFLTMTQNGFFGVTESPIDVSYLADTVLLFRYFERSGEVRQALSVVKKRSGPHDRTIRELIFGEDKISVGPALKEFDGVLTVNSSYTGS
jgi:circadian clock protein KaiC